MGAPSPAQAPVGAHDDTDVDADVGTSTNDDPDSSGLRAAFATLQSLFPGRVLEVRPRESEEAEPDDGEPFEPQPAETEEFEPFGYDDDS